jgi:hypothetical protein
VIKKKDSERAIGSGIANLFTKRKETIMITTHNWIKLGSCTSPVDGINMDQVTAFIQVRPAPGGSVMLYVGWTPEGKTPWISLQGEAADAVLQWLAARGLVDSMAVGTSS